jgi:CRP-like cAMP-binding protein
MFIIESGEAVVTLRDGATLIQQERRMGQLQQSPGYPLDPGNAEVPGSFDNEDADDKDADDEDADDEDADDEDAEYEGASEVGREVGRCEAGDHFGEAFLLHVGVRHPASVVCVTPSMRCLVLTRNVYALLMSEHLGASTNTSGPMGGESPPLLSGALQGSSSDPPPMTGVAHSVSFGRLPVQADPIAESPVEE